MPRFYTDIDICLPYFRRSELQVPKGIVEKALKESEVFVVPLRYEEVARDAATCIRSNLGVEPKAFT